MSLNHSDLMFYCPVDDLPHPAASGVNDRTLDWASGQGIPTADRDAGRLRAMAPGLLAARIAPDARGPVLDAFADHHTWLFAFDDEYCDRADGSGITEWASFLARLHRVVETGESALLPGNPYGLALRDIACRLSTYTTPAQLAEWLEALRSYFAALVWERSRRRDDDRLQSLDDYLLLRLRNGAMHTSITLLDTVNGYVLPRELRETPGVRALVEMTALLVSVDNDILSHHKESTSGTREANLLDVLGRTGHTTPGEAVAQAVALRNEIMRQFVRVAERVRTPAAVPELYRFTTGLARWIRANLDFSLTTTRYTGPVTERAALSPHEVPPLSGQGPAPARSDVIGWWWRIPEPLPEPGSDGADTPVRKRRAGDRPPTAGRGGAPHHQRTGPPPPVLPGGITASRSSGLQQSTWRREHR
ncbi:terpene synthase [Streptomyces clavuligerus]|uniref:(+)-T-muurolol synthase ((2E,6E)-farnesyl diphosphate cyclizing) n=1 Tax=Streptomyces clavuligerus TaxID=1901 RepID=TMUUS_STRCL|nr:terpene synthase [Streptomyces clavuligerus]B5GW45.1 RecName: Full=(+)-T-muurolol synthase ((2E,6E)-farnesyl diphosphate cyclizing); AltName: Full=Terpene cyclase; AltName: Full=Type I terpene synthase [Streptomyces clavuligerus]EDY50541.1 hypothetical protein SSCG_03688 [Streptomyces clavuligerus]EFG03561.1 Terpene synthase [Streptomyces clavuligerus]MBY6307857.1 terpene synthase [Streptomyces clavuligerus]QCS09590.1 terpene synthase [Streptomyces clavuligerus]QPJ98359.1 terpene synthase 